MKANELMIGDLVRVNKDVCIKKDTLVEIRGIDADRMFHELKGCATCVAVDDPDEMQGGVWLEYLDPIPLTDKILEKNGFFNDGVSFWYEDFRIVLSTSKGVSLLCGRQKRFEFVHELQHALRLCGINKTIEL